MFLAAIDPGPPVDPNDIAPVCLTCGGASSRAVPLGCDCGDYGYISSINSCRRFAAWMDAAEARHPLNRKPIRYLEAAE